MEPLFSHRNGKFDSEEFDFEEFTDFEKMKIKFHKSLSLTSSNLAKFSNSIFKFKFSLSDKKLFFPFSMSL